MAIVQCPECNKKLKVADTSVGKKVKCSCGQVFVAAPPDDAAPPPKPAVAAAAAPEKVFVACTECGAKLKVATASLGKKMKCPKCAAVFVAKIEAAPKPKPAVDDDDLDDLMNFAQSEAQSDSMSEDEEDLPKSKGKAPKKAAFDDDEEEDELPKPKPGKKAAKPPVDDDEDEEDDSPDPNAKPVYPSRLVLNIIVLLLVLAYGRPYSSTPPFVCSTLYRWIVSIRNAPIVGRIKNKRERKKEPASRRQEGRRQAGDGQENRRQKGRRQDRHSRSGVTDKIKATAKDQLVLLTKASRRLQTSRTLHFPMALNDLVEGIPPFLESKDALLDPWKQPFQYNPEGPKNGGLRPDIWTVTPDKEEIGNWPKVIAKTKDKDAKDSKKDDPKKDELQGRRTTSPPRRPSRQARQPSAHERNASRHAR